MTRAGDIIHDPAGNEFVVVSAELVSGYSETADQHFQFTVVKVRCNRGIDTP